MKVNKSPQSLERLHKGPEYCLGFWQGRRPILIGCNGICVCHADKALLLVTGESAEWTVHVSQCLSPGPSQALGPMLCLHVLYCIVALLPISHHNWGVGTASSNTAVYSIRSYQMRCILSLWCSLQHHGHLKSRLLLSQAWPPHITQSHMSHVIPKGDVAYENTYLLRFFLCRVALRI